MAKQHGKRYLAAGIAAFGLSLTTARAAPSDQEFLARAISVSQALEALTDTDVVLTPIKERAWEKGGH